MVRYMRTNKTKSGPDPALGSLGPWVLGQRSSNQIKPKPVNEGARIRQNNLLGDPSKYGTEYNICKYYTLHSTYYMLRTTY